MTLNFSALAYAEKISMFVSESCRRWYADLYNSVLEINVCRAFESFIYAKTTTIQASFEPRNEWYNRIFYQSKSYAIRTSDL